ncbi:MAG TPA: glycosyltransferase 87 family protein, partial [Candidatus Tumulicola sp.]
RALERTAPAALSTQLSQPLAVLTAAGKFGALQLAVLLLALGLATAAYRALTRSVDSNAGITAALGAVAVLACAWLVPVAFSSDVYAYAVYGEAALRGLDPFARLSLSGGSPLIDAARVQWGASLPACVYGWGFVGLSALSVGLSAPLGAAGQIAALRALATLAVLACGALAFPAFPGDRIARTRAAVFIGCNPVVLWCAAEGHNDAVAVGIALLGCALAVRRPVLGAAVAGIAGAFKFPALLSAVPAAGRRRTAWAGAALGGIVAVAATWPVVAHFGGGSNAHGVYYPQVSLQGLVFSMLSGMGAAAGTAGAAAAVVAAVAATLLATSAVAQLRRAEREGWVRLAVAAWLLIPNPYPWYGLWLVAIAAVAPSSRPAGVAVWLPAAALLRYYPDAVAVPSAAAGVLLGLAAILPYALLVPARRFGIINGPT